MQLLLDHGADPNCVDLWLETPLYKATVKGHVECMRILLEGTHTHTHTHAHTQLPQLTAPPHRSTFA